MFSGVGAHDATDQTFPDSLPNTTTLRMLFTHYLDFSAVPKRSFFELVRNFTNDDREREKMDEFISIEGAVSYLAPSSRKC